MGAGYDGGNQTLSILEGPCGTRYSWWAIYTHVIPTRFYFLRGYAGLAQRREGLRQRLVSESDMDRLPTGRVYNRFKFASV